MPGPATPGTPLTPDPEAPGSAAPVSRLTPDAAAPGTPTHDAARRAFFRELGRSAITTVGQVAGLADVVGRGTTAAAAGLLGIDLRQPPSAPPRPGTSAARPVVRTAAPTDDRYRSPYRVTEDSVVLLDQRALPGALDELTCRRGTDVAYYLRIGACRGGPLMAQVAAYGLALSARERRAQPVATRRADLRRSRESLTAARPASRALAWATRRMAAIEEGLGPDADGEALAVALRAEADAIALRMQADLDAVADHLAAVLEEQRAAIATREPERPLGVLIHGDPGGLWGGLVGPGVAALSRLAESGQPAQVVVTEGRPFMEGARLAAWELRQAGIAHQLVADAAVAWLLDRHSIDVVIIAAEGVAANGDVAAVVGSRGVAELAASARSRSEAGGPRVVVIATGSMIDAEVPDGRAMPEERRPTREMSSYLGAQPLKGTDPLNPALDVIAADRIDTLLTERGRIAPVTPDAVLAAASD